ncbi:FtsX-like permease family protein [Micromonospora sp. KC606]|uniref:FtsX-like permease family protein n=1 Tax=Micromonospora sp. KC606 TaxID=2530379 RepID=UPI00105261C6|nr:FtsX-like permease family protein [Micromonospora sp. KC606]TDC85617.1 FtsX-like permease family protein [Micromonospora sp. KC606]
MILRTQLSALARRPARALLTGLALTIAACAVFGTVLAHQVARQVVVDRLSQTPAATNLVVGATPTLDTLQKVRAVPGVAEAVGRVDGYVQLERISSAYLQINADPGSGPMAKVRLTEGRYPSAPDELAVSRRTADRLKLPVGAVVNLRLDAPDSSDPDAGRETVRATVTGLVETADDGWDTAYTTDVFAARLAVTDRWTQIDVRVAPGVSVDAVRTDLAALVGADASDSIMTGAQARASEQEAALADIDAVFVAMSLFVALAIIAAALVTASTFRIVFAQRLRQLALLRAVGADRRALARALAAEGALTGLVAAVLGVLAASALGLLAPLVLRSFGIDVPRPGFPVGTALAVVAGTVLMTVLTVLAPAFAAARVAPLEALRTASTTAGGRGIGGVRAVIGGLFAGGAVLSAAVAATLLGGSDSAGRDSTVLLLVLCSFALAFLALLTLGPVVVRPVLAVVSWPLRKWGAIGRLAASGVGAASRRAAAVSTVVALGVTLIALTLVIGATTQAATDRQATSMAPGDFNLIADDGAVVPDSVIQKARTRPELTAVVPYRTATVRIGTSKSDVLATDLDLRQLATRGPQPEPRTAPESRRVEAEATAPKTVDAWHAALDRAVARAAGVRPGDSVTITTGQRTLDVRVTEILDATPLATGIIVSPTDLDQLGVPPGPTGLLANATRPGEPGRTAAYQALEAISPADQGLRLSVLADQRDQTREKTNALIVVLLALISLTVVVAVVGVGITTALSVVERVRESGLLRAVGMSRRGLTVMLTTEAALYGALGATIGVVLGLPYAAMSIKTFDSTVPVEIPFGQLAVTVAVLTTLTGLAGLLPARRAARISPMEGLATDG